MPSIINLRGYSSPDPLDKAPGIMNYILLIGINCLLTLGLEWMITSYGLVHFNGKWTILVEIVINMLVFSPLIILSRKCSSVIPYLIVFLPYFLLDLFTESHFRTPGKDISRALWTYSASLLPFIHTPALKIFLTMSVDGIIFGILSLFLARLLASLIYHKRPYPKGPTPAQYENLFRKEWSDEQVAKPPRDLGFYVLRLLGIGYGIYLLFLLLGKMGATPWKPADHLIWVTYSNPALAINTFFKISLMVILAFTAAYNRALRFYCGAALFTGHLISTVFSLVFHFTPSLNATESSFLLLSGELDGAMVLIFFWIMIRYKKDSKIFAPENDNPIDFSLPMTLLKLLYTAMGLAFAGIVIFIILERVMGSGDSGISAVFGFADPLIGNTITLYGTLSLISFLLINRIQLRVPLFNAIVIPLFFGSLLSLIWLLVCDMRVGILIRTRHFTWIHVDWYFILVGLVGLSVGLLLVMLRRMQYRVDYGINSINPSAAIDALALMGAFYQGDDKQRSAELQYIDAYAGGIRGRKRGLLNLPFELFENLLNFIYGMRPCFSSMNRDEQRYYLWKYFFRNELDRKSAFIPPLAELSSQIGLSLNGIITFAEFSYINARNNIGYVPPDARDRTQGDCVSTDPPYNKIARLPMDHLDPANYKPAPQCQDGPLIAPRVTTPVKEDELPREADYVIIGSGAGGATMAYRLACQVKDPSRIFVVETGNRFQPLQDFQDSEMDMYRKLYKEGGLQQTKGFTMSLVQGECVGGSTVINNAVCFEMPAAIQQLWKNEFDIDLSSLKSEYKIIEEELHIRQLGQKGINRVVKNKFQAAVSDFNKTLSSADHLQIETVRVNHRNNTGDGNWNLGNKRMQKRSMLETYIPWSEARGVKVISNLSAVKFTSSDGCKADQLILRAANGKLSKVSVSKAIIVAGGAVSSSQLLIASEVANENIGKNLACNFAFPVTFDFDEEIRAFDGDQITMAALDPHLRSAFETYFNPPATFAITSVPFFFERRDSVMSRYKYLLNFGSLIGSEPNGVVLKKADLFDGLTFSWELGEKDNKHIKYAFKTLLQLGKLAGARRAILPTKPGIELDLSDPNIIEEFSKAIGNYPLSITDLYMGTAHPQGGNLMAGKNSRQSGKRVINENFQVDGYENVFVADASLFPTSITVNPQWTIMAMSSMAAKKVIQFCP